MPIIGKESLESLAHMPMENSLRDWSKTASFIVLKKTPTDHKPKQNQKARESETNVYWTLQSDLSTSVLVGCVSSPKGELLLCTEVFIRQMIEQKSDKFNVFFQTGYTNIYKGNKASWQSVSNSAQLTYLEHYGAQQVSS